MDKAYWQAKWENNELGFNQSIPNPLLQQYISCLNLKPNARVFVPLCGKSIDMMYLLSLGYQVIGVELSLQACEAFFDEQNLSYETEKQAGFTVLKNEQVTLYCGDFFQLSKAILGKIDAIYDRAALIALPENLRAQYAKHMIELFDSHSQMLLMTMDYDENEMAGPPFSVDDKIVTDLYGQYLHIALLYHEPFDSISGHLEDKGLKKASNRVFHLQGFKR